MSVLVRSLATDTLNLLGSGVSYSYGDMGNYRSLLDAMEDVDKVVFAASAADGEDELAGLQNVLRAFQDTRTFMYGEAEATKLSLFKFRKPDHFNRWAIESDGADDAVAKRLAAAGMRASPSVAYWKRSTSAAGSHKISAQKFQYVKEFLTVGCSVLMSDIDVVYLQDPFLFLHNDADVEGTTDGWDDGSAYGWTEHLDDPSMGLAGRFRPAMRITAWQFSAQGRASWPWCTGNSPIRRNRSNCAATCRTPGRSTWTSWRSRPSAPPGSGRAGIKAALPLPRGWAGNNKPY